MKNPKFQLARLAAAVAIALAGSFPAVPALAETGADPAPAGATPAAAPSAVPSSIPSPSGPPAVPAPGAAPVVSDAGLAEAVRRDLGMTLEEFNAAGEQAKRAADAVPSLRELPGYAGTSLKDGKIAVEGHGAELQARVDQLNQTGTAADFVLVASPAAAAAAPPTAAELMASSTEQLFQAYVREVGSAGLQAVVYADGHFIIRTGGTNSLEAGPPAILDPQLPPVTPVTTAPVTTAPATPAPGKLSAAEFVARYANVQLEKGAPIRTEEDLYGGEGYWNDVGQNCSAGFGAFSSTGQPLVLTAGHCAADGTARVTEIEQPTGSQAATGLIGARGERTGLLGSFGFSQFGGADNTAITGTQDTPGNVGTDIAVIEGLPAGLSVLPAATKWDAPANPARTAVKIIGKTAPFQGQAVCRSGRTTGWQCGTVDSLGIWVIPGPKSLPPNNDNDLRAIRAFDSTSVKSGGGDSGGPWISGSFAVGTHTGAEIIGSTQIRAIATTLEDAMTYIPGGAQLQLFLNKPELVAPANRTFTAGEPITGRVPAAPASAVAANSKVRITVAGQQPVELPVDAAGNWSFPTPSSTGRFQFSAETVNGFSRSGAASLSINVSDLVAPEISSPTEGAELKAVDRVEGTGTPGHEVLLSGDVTGSGVVSADGRWSISVADQQVYGKLSVIAVQTAPGHEHGPSATRNFTVIPPSPAVSSIPDGVHFSADRLPETISGAGIDGAEVTVLIDGVPVAASQAGGAGGFAARGAISSLAPQVLVAGGRWSVPFPAGLAAGAHTLSVSQSVDGVPSAAVGTTFTIRAAAPAAVPPAVPAAAPAAVDVAPAAVPVQPSGSGQLANTGAGGLLPAAGLGAGVLLLGGVAMLSVRRRLRR
ncbi:MAG: trypsin-like serine protease [Arthrobacter sp.]|nr:trypsin-like serine protease [Arthrobacter sp.]